MSKFALDLAKKKKYLLSIEDSISFDLIGICTHVSDYRLVWNLNTVLEMHLSKSEEDYEMFGKKNEDSTRHSMYSYKDEINRVEFYLLKNKHHGKCIIPEVDYVDYFLFLQNNVSFDVQELVQKIKTVPIVLAAYSFDPEELDSAFDIELN